MTVIQAKAVSKLIRISPTKTRRVLNQIRGRSFDEAFLLLYYMPCRASTPILKVLSAAGAKAKVELGVKSTDLFISEIQVNKGPTMKRFRPRAKGRGFAIQKPTCNVSITVRTF